jgi:hypothetical protein
MTTVDVDLDEMRREVTTRIADRRMGIRGPRQNKQNRVHAASSPSAARRIIVLRMPLSKDPALRAKQLSKCARWRRRCSARVARFCSRRLA